MLKDSIKVWLMVLLAPVIIGTSAGATIYDNVKNGNTTSEDATVVDADQDGIPDDQDTDISIAGVSTTPAAFAGLIIGFDKSKGLTDVLMVGYLDTEKNEVKVVSVPRDLLIDFSDPRFAPIKEANPDNKAHRCKLNEVYGYTGKTKQSLMDIRAIITEITGIKIDYMATIDLDAFKETVDILGGIPFDVPQKMKYSDPEQDLFIDLEAGYQVLDGDKAEQLVRFRKYPTADLQRIQVQQGFIRAMVAQVFKTTDVSTLKDLATTIYGMIDSDFGLAFAMQYADYFFKLDPAQFLNAQNMITVPSYGEKINGIWFQKWNQEEVNKAVADLFSDEPTLVETPTETTSTDSSESTSKDTDKKETSTDKETKPTDTKNTTQAATDVESTSSPAIEMPATDGTNTTQPATNTDPVVDPAIDPAVDPAIDPNEPPTYEVDPALQPDSNVETPPATTTDSSITQ